jgi:hypothetical protein
MDGVRFRNTTTEIDSGIDISTDLSARKSLLIADRTSTDLGLVDLDAMLQDDDESWWVLIICLVYPEYGQFPKSLS